MYLYGASGHCKVIIDIIKSSTNKTIEAVFDDAVKENTILGIKIVDFKKNDNYKIDELIISVGKNSTRKKMVEKLHANFVSVIHQTAIVSKFVTIDVGTVVMPGVIINASTKVGKHCIINSGAIIGHGCKLNDFVHISPSASLAGNVTIGEGSHIGIGAIVIQGISIGKWASIGAGTVIINDVPDGAVVVVNPGKIIKINTFL
ncbi:acetyltransferase [Lutibacter sp.]|uniref:acetyltransferase n=1 Tax=Lutibacter sp. TaxID=1925666 RepID=UPI0027361BE3|nr:acetyltransferase [Lutibacter sp.]MDP3313048.1 acetyltransferase [Lutibacter sp.]